VDPRRTRHGMSAQAGRQTYQIRVAGLLPEQHAREVLLGCQVEGHHLRSVLVGRLEGRGALFALLQQLRGHGLEVLDVRRVPGEVTPSLPRGARTRCPVDGVDYEVAVAGEVTEAIQRGLEPCVMALAGLHTVLRATVPPEVRFVDLVLWLESRGLRIASIAAVGSPAGVPGQRRSHEGDERARRRPQDRGRDLRTPA
jgi:hypothetical protein